MSNKVKNKIDENVVRRDIFYGVPCAMSRKGMCNVAIECAKVISELECLEFLKTEAPEVYSEGELDLKIKMATEKKAMLDQVLDSGQGTELISCEKVYNYSKRRVQVFREDTKEMVEDRAMLPQEWLERPRAVQASKPRNRKEVLLQGAVPAAHQLAASAS